MIALKHKEAFNLCTASKLFYFHVRAVQSNQNPQTSKRNTKAVRHLFNTRWIQCTGSSQSKLWRKSLITYPLSTQGGALMQLLVSVQLAVLPPQLPAVEMFCDLQIWAMLGSGCIADWICCGDSMMVAVKPLVTCHSMWHCWDSISISNDEMEYDCTYMQNPNTWICSSISPYSIPTCRNSPSVTSHWKLRHARLDIQAGCEAKSAVRHCIRTLSIWIIVICMVEASCGPGIVHTGRAGDKLHSMTV